MTKAIFFDIFGTLVDWRGTLIHNIKKKMVFEKNNSFIELLVINWRLEYQPILDKVKLLVAPEIVAAEPGSIDT